MRIRRTPLATATLAVAVVTALGTTAIAIGASGTATADAATAVPDPVTSSLRDLAQHTRLRIGTAVDTSALAADTTYRGLVAEQFDSVTPENVMKWEAVEPERGVYDYAAADQLVAFARANRQLVRGHTLLWHNQLPAWLTSGTWTKAELRSILRQHIFAEAGHFRGRIWAWDVVNEAFNDDGTLRDTLWLRVIGPSYLSDAFRWAHQADPNAVLFYNDYNIEGINPKSDAVFDLVRSLRADGVPVQGVGLQGHLGTQYNAPTDVLQNLRRFAKLGVDTAITEADVRSVLPVDSAELSAQADGYSLMLESCLLVRSCVSYTVWGFTDKYQWVPGVFDGQGAAALYDENYRPRPAYDALRRDLALAPTLGSRGHARAG